MKFTKNTVLKYSNYTAALTRSLKATERLHCRVDEEQNAVYVCNGYFLVKLNPAEYDALVRPVTQREAGNYVINTDGETDTTHEPLDAAKLLADAARDAAHELTPAPFLFDPHTKGTKAKIATYYSESGDFVAGFNSDYAAIISGDLPRKSKNAISPMVVFSGDEPQAMILPVRLDETKSRVPAAVRAYFTDKPQESGDEKLTRARKERDDWENTARRLEAERDSREAEAAQLRRENEQLRQDYAQKHIDGEELRRQIEELQAVLASKNEQIEALTGRLNAQPDPQPAPVVEVQPEQAPADKAAALVEKLAALEGITATIKGAQTAAPVVWLTGEADAHKDKIEAMGGKWSAKRGAWYFKI